ncbi:MAG: hypothetical protein QXT53_05425 [Ignisphaera sp.]
MSKRVKSRGSTIRNIIGGGVPIVLIIVGIMLEIGGLMLLLFKGIDVIIDESVLSIPRSFYGEVEIGVPPYRIVYENISLVRNVELIGGVAKDISEFSIKNRSYYPIIITIRARSIKQPINLYIQFINASTNTVIGGITPSNSTPYLDGQFIVDAVLPQGSYRVNVLSNYNTTIYYLAVSGIAIVNNTRSVLGINFSPQTAYNYFIKYVKGLNVTYLAISIFTMNIGSMFIVIGTIMFIGKDTLLMRLGSRKRMK